MENCKNCEPKALAVLVISKFIAVKATAALFQVCERSSTGALAVSVPLLADSVVNAPVFGVVEPMAGGAAKSSVRAMVPEAGTVSVEVVAVVRPSTSKATFLVGSAEPTTRNISSAGSLGPGSP